jgi:hypothetical protein
LRHARHARRATRKRGTHAATQRTYRQYQAQEKRLHKDAYPVHARPSHLSKPGD